ncbi:hypothetical protein BU24DRAFT_267167 [Aaosphaeria arxii CBS 175.79]|uniref:Ribonuclease H1 N-terminal domain-containing protein n=1 Tax=Aaosphaeria arxii CBS 175.79 TaxID=1450172 RepID=A0A6A5XGL1_9PLEO|nr:uncharacterized protein BU24DRAFT_267167 [Aaosphaeria arxii CBS 175.79]KAF2011977.1 hypothetical protein BU24DRAFT_267167 [Aaosphaeria arxii CBS 175.79]
MRGEMGKSKTNFYVVFSGRIEECTVFSSWGDVHPRISGCDSKIKGFKTVEDARKYMDELGLKCKEDIKDTALDTTPTRNSYAYYAVANGRFPGIKRIWYGEAGAKDDTDQFNHTCHKHFRTEAQAKAFIEDWKNAYADVVCRATVEALERGAKPSDLDFVVLIDWKEAYADAVRLATIKALSEGTLPSELNFDVLVDWKKNMRRRCAWPPKRHSMMDYDLPTLT